MKGAAAMLACAVVVVIGVAACGDAPTPSVGQSAPVRPAVSPAPGDHTLYLNWQGVERTYEVHAPASYRPQAAVPLVIALHGRPSSAAQLRRTTGLDAVADREGFLIAYPNGIDGRWNALGCCGETDDVGFLRAVVDHLVKTWGADPRRTYATGFSDGARMSYELAVKASETFSAIAPVSGGFDRGPALNDIGYKPTAPVSVVAFTGNDDRIANQIYHGISRWHRNVGCTASEPVWVDKAQTVNRTVARCADGSEVVDYVINKMSHAWPAPSDHPAAIDAGAVMWEFFARHSR
ncbi:polyhydroxybutyrate depolymerase [Micromonospora sp. CPCC 205371]|nr:polyhydroxybutyrate depolymerase [Micromonospora sp. CPCC 205371]